MIAREKNKGFGCALSKPNNADHKLASRAGSNPFTPALILLAETNQRFGISAAGASHARRISENADSNLILAQHCSVVTTELCLRLFDTASIGVPRSFAVWAKVSSGSDVISYEYDAAGQTVKARNTLGTITYEYSNRGMTTRLTHSISGSGPYVLVFGYDAGNELKSVTYPDAKVVSYDYDRLGRTNFVNRTSPTFLFLLIITYNFDDTVATEKIGETTQSKAKTTTFAYTNRDWINTIVMMRGTTTKLSLDYNYDDVGNVVRLTDVLGSKVERYTYDWLDRLTSASGGSLPAGLTYTYDAVGNRLTLGATTYPYGTYNKLAGDGTWTYQYGDNGNLTSRTASTSQYLYKSNSLDQLIKATKMKKQGGSWVLDKVLGEYWYDANGARARTLESATDTKYVYLGHDPIYEVTGSTTQTDYVSINGRLKARLTGSNTYYLFADALGSTRQVWKDEPSDMSTTPTSLVITYKPFGTPVTGLGAEKVMYAGELMDTAASSTPCGNSPHKDGSSCGLPFDFHTSASVTRVRELLGSCGALGAEHGLDLLPRGFERLCPRLLRDLPERLDLLVEGVDELGQNLVDRKKHRHEDDPVLADPQRIELRRQGFQAQLDDVLNLPILLVG